MIKNLVKKIIVFLLEWEARLVLARFRPKIVAVTGTVGKTSTKDAVFAVLSHSFFVRKSQKSYNSEIGLPLTILGCDNAWNNPILWLRNLFDGLFLLIGREPYPEWLVLEVGVGHPGDMRRLARWLKIDAVIFTRFGNLPVNMEDVFGQNHVYAGLAALAFAYGQKINLLSAVEALRRYDTPPGRMRLIEGLKGSWIIDDTYNSSP